MMSWIRLQLFNLLLIVICVNTRPTRSVFLHGSETKLNNASLSGLVQIVPLPMQIAQTVWFTSELPGSLLSPKPSSEDSFKPYSEFLNVQTFFNSLWAINPSLFLHVHLFNTPCRNVFLTSIWWSCQWYEAAKEIRRGTKSYIGDWRRLLMIDVLGTLGTSWALSLANEPSGFNFMV